MSVPLDSSNLQDKNRSHCVSDGTMKDEGGREWDMSFLRTGHSYSLMPGCP